MCFKNYVKDRKRSLPLIVVTMFTIVMLLVTASEEVQASSADALEITKSVDNNTPLVGDDNGFTYTLNYRCAHLTDTHCNDVVITDQLNGYVDFIGGSVGAHPATITDDGSGLITVTFDDPLPAGSTGQIDLSARINLNANVPDGQVIPNTATINASNGDPVTSNEVTITATYGDTPWDISKYGDASQDSALDTTFRWKIGIEPGSTPMEDAVITDTIPAGTNYIGCGSAYTSSGVSCSYDSASRTVTWVLPTPWYDWISVWVELQFPSGTFSVEDTVENTACWSGEEFFGTPVTDCATHNVDIIEPVAFFKARNKRGFLGEDIWGTTQVAVGEEAAYVVEMNSAGQLAVTGAYVNDYLPAELDFTRMETGIFTTSATPPTGYNISYEIDNSGSWVSVPNTAYDNGGPLYTYDDTITRAELGISPTARVTGIRWDFGDISPDFSQDHGSVIYGIINNTATVGGTVQNCMITGGTNTTGGDGGHNDMPVGDGLDSACGKVSVLAGAAGLDSFKWVKGIDAPTNPINSDVCEVTTDGYTRYPCVATTVPGGAVDYRIVIQNPGTVSMTDLVIYDILPHIGDTGVILPDARDTEWRPGLVGAASAPAGVTVYYSQSSNPCRSEVNPSGPAGCTNDWTTTLPGNPGAVQALKFDFAGLIIDPNDEFVLEWPMRAPVSGSTSGEIAWNSLAYQADRVDTGDPLLASEPPKVGVILGPIEPAAYGDFVWLDSNANGIQDGGEPGLDGVRVELYRDNGDNINDPANDAFVSFTLTSNGGEYLFPNLEPDDYYAVFYPPPTYDVSPVDNNGNSDDEIDSDATPSTFGGLPVAIAPVTNLTADEVDITWDLGLYQPITIGDYIWYDFNQDGIQNQGESGLAGVSVSLYDNAACTGLEIANTTTSAIGWYSFEGLAKGQDYCVQATYPGNWTLTQQDAGADDALDSDLSAVDGTTGNISAINTLINNMTFDGGLHHADMACQIPLPTAGINGIVNNSADWANPIRHDIQFGELTASGWCAEQADQTPQNGQQYSLQLQDRQGFSAVQKDNLSRLFRFMSDPEITNAVVASFDSVSEHNRFNEMIQYVVWYYTDWNKDFAKIIEYIDDRGWPVAQANAMKALAQLIINKTEGLNGEIRYEPMTIYYLWNEDDTDYQDVIVPETLVSPHQAACLRADVELAKAVSTPSARRGETVIYTLTLTNQGPDNASGITITDQLPNSLTYVGSTAQQGSYDPNTGIWNVGNVPANESKTLDITVTIK